MEERSILNAFLDRRNLTGQNSFGFWNWRKAVMPRMNEPTRRAVAYIAGRAVSRKNSSAVFEYSSSQYFSFSGKVTETGVSTYDYSQSCHISGSGQSGTISLFHYGNGKHITLRLNGSKFRGFDYSSGNYFSGTVRGKAITVFDYERGAWFNYAI